MWGAPFRKRLFGISLEETTFARRGFRDDQEALKKSLTERLAVARFFGRGPESGDSQLKAVDAEYRGFAFEGAGMGLTLLDHVAPFRKDRLRFHPKNAGHN